MIFRIAFTIPLALHALLYAASGVVGIRHGWVFPIKAGGGLELPMYRRRVRRVRLYAWGLLMLAVGLCLQVVFLWVLSDIYLWILVSTAVWLPGRIVMMVSQRAGGDRQGQRA
ncbi:hypothetical protein [Streptomyces sp. NPDC056190]|uniref:hypothetical protein n=1 Tax=unclassified Streptomyces TaxID=2593676 RepID=UPI0035E27597